VAETTVAADTYEESDCDPVYTEVCIPWSEYDLDCADIAETDFTVDGADPNGFDGDGDGVGCESGYGEEASGESYTEEDLEDLDADGCSDSYPDICVPSDAYDLDCADVGDTDFTVDGDDPYGFDGEGDGIGCESYDAGDDYYGDSSYGSDSTDDDPTYYDESDGFTDDYGSGDGYPVICNDGTMSDSGGIQGACSHHGGVAP
jgi:hypothetical protein